ncbi:GumC family protein [Solitalea lacus]|uniref:GumC family protein n=1 Tax=Solitalea lacus TaxID=2911172 RepID=UPI001EDAB859|nr:polysaccharide biosynthesis tyrosine autokinase [Solitalea lacus]UKJ07239.1 polysaccharide biosynthesis tyrosine autokinase [Solitalea lacus]
MIFNSSQNSAEPEIGFKDFFEKCLKKWYWFVLSVLCCFILGWSYLKITRPQYQITSSVLVKQEQKSSEKKESVLEELNVFNDSKLIDNEMEIVKARLLMENVVNDLNLTVNYYLIEPFTWERFFKGPWRSREIYKNVPIKVIPQSLEDYAYENELELVAIDSSYFRILNGGGSSLYKFGSTVHNEFGRFRVDRVFYSADAFKSFRIRFKSNAKTIEDYRDKLLVAPASENATVFNINLSESLPDKGIDIVNALVQEYNKKKLEVKKREALKALTFLDNRLKLLSGELKNAEENVEQYKTSKEITNISSESAILLEKVKENDLMLNQVDNQLKMFDNIGSSISSGQPIPSSLLSDNKVLQDKIGQLNTMELEKARLLQSMGEKNPLVETVNEQIKNSRESIDADIQQIKRELQITRSNLQRNNSKFDASIRSVPLKERNLVTVERQKNLKEGLYIYLLQKREETALSYDTKVYDSNLIDPAHSSILPISPVPLKTYLIAFVLGLAIPVISFWSSSLIGSEKVTDQRLISSITQAPVLGVIGKNHSKDRLVVWPGSRTVISEQFKFLRTNLLYVNKGLERKFILVTSSVSEEGKSFVSLNLAASIALTGKKVMLIEFDLRKPDLSADVIKGYTKGISDYLKGQATKEEIIQQSDRFDDLFFIGCGTIPNDPAELLLNDRLNDMMKYLEERFDCIIMDCSPIGLVSDAMVVEKFADMSLYIIRYNHTYYQQLKNITELYLSGKFKNMGIVFNSVDTNNGYGGNYGKNYKNYYSEDPSHKGLLERFVS